MLCARCGEDRVRWEWARVPPAEAIEEYREDAAHGLVAVCGECLDAARLRVVDHLLQQVRKVEVTS